MWPNPVQPMGSTSVRIAGWSRNRMIQYDDAWSYGENGKKANKNEPHHFKVLQPRGWVFRFFRGARSSLAWYKTCWWRNWNVSSSRTRASAATDASYSASGPASAVSARVPAQLPILPTDARPSAALGPRSGPREFRRWRWAGMSHRSGCLRRYYAGGTPP